MAGELDTELEEQPGVEADLGGDDGDGLTGSLPPDEPSGAMGQGGGGRSGGSGGGLDTGGLADPVDGTPLRGSIPFMNLQFDPIVHQLCIMDSKTRAHRHEYRGMTRSDAVVHFLTRLSFEDFESKVAAGEIDGFANDLGDRLLKIMRAVRMTALDELRATVRADVISTLVQRGVSSQERLEEVLGVPSHGVS